MEVTAAQSIRLIKNLSSSQAQKYKITSACAEKETAHSVGSLSDEEANFSLPNELAERLVRRTENRVAQVISQSLFLQTNCTLYTLPRFTREELHIGPMIAYGGFSTVHTIEGYFGVDCELEMENKKYIVKSLNPKLAFHPKKLLVGAKDLVVEAHFLSSLSHEHIIELRGWSSSGVSGFATSGRADGFFLIMDRLQVTLAKQISRWRDEIKRSSKNALLGSQPRTKTWVRIGTAAQIASALAYLHENRIVYRDLKPANIGFDATGTLKIFDFGLAVELPPSDDPHQTFNLAGNTGTSRYMAVEVIKKLPYNCKADVFSFSVVLWEVMALTKPYDGLVGHQVKECVSVYGDRPNIPRGWPVQIQRLLRRGWAEALESRPAMPEVRDTLLSIVKPKRNFKPSLFDRTKSY